MKRILALSLIFLMLAACVPTPEEEAVIHKNEGTLEQQLAATPVPDYQSEDVVKAEGEPEAVTAEQNTLRLSLNKFRLISATHFQKEFYSQQELYLLDLISKQNFNFEKLNNLD